MKTNTLDKTKKKGKRKNEGGRPTVMTKETLDKLEHAFSMGATDREACFYAGISDDCLYKYQREHPLFIKRKEDLKESPILKAKTTIIEGLSDAGNAKWYLERKRRDEFSPSEKIDVEATHHIQFEVIKFE